MFLVKTVENPLNKSLGIGNNGVQPFQMLGIRFGIEYFGLKLVTFFLEIEVRTVGVTGYC